MLLAMFVTATYAQDDDSEGIEPFLQSDFQIVSGDVLRPNGIYWFEGDLYTGCAGDWTIYRINADTGDTLTYIFGIKNTHSLYVERVEEATDPTVWAVDFQDSILFSVNVETGLVPVREGLAAPWGLAASATDDTFYITEWESDNLINITREGDITVVASDFVDPSGLVATEDRLYVANNGSVRRAVEWIDMSEGSDRTPQPLVTGLQDVTGLVLAVDGNLYIAYALGTRGVIGRVNPESCVNGGCTNADVELIAWTELPAPLAGLTISPDMRLFVHTIFGAEIYYVDIPQEVASIE